MVILRTVPLRNILTMYLPEREITGTPAAPGSRHGAGATRARWAGVARRAGCRWRQCYTAGEAESAPLRCG